MFGNDKRLQHGSAIRRSRFRVISVVAFSLLLTGTSIAQTTANAKPTPPKPVDNYDELYAKYLNEAHNPPPHEPQTQAWAWMTNLGQDFRARAVNDLLTIRVVESISGSGSADAALAKDGSANVALKGNPVDWKFGVSTNTDFKGAGTTTRAGELTANLTARVSDVLPNGDLVIEGVREVEINGDRQVVVLTGVVRPVDVAQRNIVSSTAIGQLRIRYFGRGLMKDNLEPGWLVKILNKVF